MCNKKITHGPTRVWVSADPVDHRGSVFRLVISPSRRVKRLLFPQFLRHSVALFRHAAVPVLKSRHRQPGEADDGQIPVSADDTADGCQRHAEKNKTDLSV